MRGASIVLPLGMKFLGTKLTSCSSRSTAGFRLSSETAIVGPVLANASSCPGEGTGLNACARRKLAQQRDHPVVVLQRMEAYPRHDVLAGREVLVEGLVHVPQDGDACHTL